MAASSPTSARQRLSRVLLAALVLAVALWFAFFDSHSLTRRLRWHHEHARLIQENEQLRREIERLEARLETRVTDEVVEQIAREQYGMRRPGETVYRVEESE